MPRESKVNCQFHILQHIEWLPISISLLNIFTFYIKKGNYILNDTNPSILRETLVRRSQILIRRSQTEKSLWCQYVSQFLKKSLLVNDDGETLVCCMLIVAVILWLREVGRRWLACP